MTDKIKILYLMAGHSSIFGGGKRVFLQIMKYLNKDKFRFYSCCALNKEQEQFLIENGGSIVQLDIQHDSIWPSVKKLIKLLAREEIDIIHSQGARADVYSRVAVRLARTKTQVVNTIAMLVEGYDVGLLRKIVYCILDRFSERYVDKFIVVSHALKRKLLINHKIPEEKLITIYNAIELQEYRPDAFTESPRKIRREFGINDTEFIICAIGRMVWQKGFEFLIKAMPQILRETPKATFLFIGDGPLRSSLEALTREQNVDRRAIFTGFRSDIPDLLSTMDVLVVPSLSEGFPLIVLEAMAMSKPIVSSQIQGIVEQISDEVEGLLVPSRSPEALARAVKRLITDRELSARLGMAARKRVESSFSVEKMVRETEKVYLSLLKDK